MADFQIKLNRANNYTVAQEKTVVAEFLSDLADVSVSDLPSKDNYILSYNATLQKYELVSADIVLENSASDSDIPDTFVNQLQVELDDQIDVDGGGF
jgi:hypothetical protein